MQYTVTFASIFLLAGEFYVTVYIRFDDNANLPLSVGI